MKTDWKSDLRRLVAMLDARRQPRSNVIELDAERKKRAAAGHDDSRPQGTGRPGWRCRREETDADWE